MSDEQASWTWQSAFKLTAIGAVAAGVLGMALMLTRDRITQQEHQAQLQALSALLPESGYDNDPIADAIRVTEPDFLRSADSTMVYRARFHGQPVSLVLSVVAPDGYAGAVRLLIGIAYDGTIIGVRVTSHQETPGLGDGIEIAKSDWITRFDGKSLTAPAAERWAVQRDGGDFDQFAGATVTPRAIVSAVRKALEYYRANRDRLYQ